MRLEKLIADAEGVTRKEAKALIKKGRISLNGEIVRDGAAKAEESDEITLDGRAVLYKKFIYIMMNKPQGYVSSTDEPNKKTVLELLPENFSRYALFPAGRLDIDTEGFLLLTNDGQTAHNLLSPAKKVPKTYAASLQNSLSEEDRQAIEKGIDIGGYVTKPCRITPLENFDVLIEISEGKFHQVKRMFEAVGNRVVFLKRITFAGLELDKNLAIGEYRFLTENEVKFIGGSL